MIKYSLKCASDHSFESWFKDSATFEALKQEGHITCPMCGEWQVTKALMTPHLANNAGKGRGTGTDASLSDSSANTKVQEPEQSPDIKIDTLPRAPKSGEPMPSQEEITAAFQFFAKLKKHVVETHEDVGENFSNEARRIHYGETRERGIFGNANQDDVEELMEEGIVVMPLPNMRHDA